MAISELGRRENYVGEKYLIESYRRLFISKSGLGDFVIYDADVQLRNKLNEKYNDEVKKVWKLIKDYI